MSEKNILFPNKKEKWDFAIAIIVILIVGYFVYSKVFRASNEPISERLINTEISIEEYNVQGTKDVVKEKETLSKVENSPLNKENSFFNLISNTESDRLEKDSTIVYIKPIVKAGIFKKVEEEVVFIDKEELKDDTEEIKEVFEDEEIIELENNSLTETGSIEKIEQEDIELEEENIKEDIIVTEEEVITQKEDAIVTEKQSAPSNNTSYAETDCIIVIGVFEEAYNKTKIINRLTNLGYSHDEGIMRNGLTYVGVPIMCEDKIKRRSLTNELNNEFNVEAWVKKK